MTFRAPAPEGADEIARRIVAHSRTDDDPTNPDAVLIDGLAIRGRIHEALAAKDEEIARLRIKADEMERAAVANGTAAIDAELRAREAKASLDEEIARLRSERLELDRRIHNQRERLRQHEGWTASGARGTPAGGNGPGWRVSASRYLDIATRAHQARRAAESEVTRLRARVEELTESLLHADRALFREIERGNAAEAGVTRLKAELATRERRGWEAASDYVDELPGDEGEEHLAAGLGYAVLAIRSEASRRFGGEYQPDDLRSAASKLPAAGETGWRPTHQHYKGGLYRVIARGKIEADLTPCVVYDDRFGEVWVRPQTNFDGVVDENGYIPRFAPLPAPPQSAAE